MLANLVGLGGFGGHGGTNLNQVWDGYPRASHGLDSFAEGGDSGASGGGSQFWVQGNSVVQGAGAHIGVWDYPGGGKPTKRFTMPVGETSDAGIAISEAPSSK